MSDKDKFAFIGWCLWWITCCSLIIGNLPAGVIMAAYALMIHESIFPFGKIEKNLDYGIFYARQKDGWKGLQ